MPSDMGSRKLGSGRYRGLDEESHMPGFQTPWANLWTQFYEAIDFRSVK